MASGATYIIIIAVENYHHDETFRKVSYAKKDSDDLKNAFLMLGYDEGDITYLVDDFATKTSIYNYVEKIAKKTTENDKIIFYFAGHGLYNGERNYLLPVDADRDNIVKTSVAIDELLGYLKNSRSEHSILFIDCCHSGFQAGKYGRDLDDYFSVDEMIYSFKDEKYCVGFSSCQKSEKSYSFPAIKNGVWTHFLVKALRGEANPKIYKKGLLFSDQLQSYLRNEVYKYVKMNHTQKADQTPVKFGTETDKFIIANLNPIFEEKRRKLEEKEIPLPDVLMKYIDSDFIKKLPGFISGRHHVPKDANSTTRLFVYDIGSELIERDIKNISDRLKDKIKYKRVDMVVNVTKYSGSITTPDFDYKITLEQSEDEPDRYILTRTLENFKNSSIAMDDNFNAVFSDSFDELELMLNTNINITELIDRIEALNNENIKVDYDSSNLEECTITIEDLPYELLVTPYSISIVCKKKTNPKTLVNAFVETRSLIALTPGMHSLT